MADVRYFVRFFERLGDKLVGSPPREMTDHLAAIGDALRRTQEDAAGAIVYAAARNQDVSELEIIIKVGDVPDEIAAALAPE
jgi:hypothetical protein